MDSHRPKPWRGGRAFLKEYVIIVVGVLTALGAGQAVETVQWNQRVDAAEVRMKRELGVSYMFALERSMLTPCLDRRLIALKTALLSDTGEWRPLPPMHSPVLGDKAFLVPSRLYEDQVWKSVQSDGTAAHLTPSRSGLYARAYSQTAGAAGSAPAEFIEIATLNLLNNSTALPLPQRLDLISRIEQEQVRANLAGVTSRQMMFKIKAVAAIDEAKAEAWVLRISNTYQACERLGLLDANAPRSQLAADPTAAATEYPDVTRH